MVPSAPSVVLLRDNSVTSVTAAGLRYDGMLRTNALGRTDAENLWHLESTHLHQKWFATLCVQRCNGFDLERSCRVAIVPANQIMYSWLMLE